MVLLNGIEIAETAAKAAADKKALDVLVLDLRNVSPVTDYFVICSGRSSTQVKAIADAVEEKLSESGVAKARREGLGEGGWILLDYESSVVHVFDEGEREFYKLESLWKDAARVNIE